MARLRCVFYDPDAVDSDSRLTARALEACERAGVLVYALAGDEAEVRVGDEEHAVDPDDGPIVFVMRAHGFERGECIGVGAVLADQPLASVWVRPDDLEVRGSAIRVAEDDEVLYGAVIAELAQRR